MPPATAVGTMIFFSSTLFSPVDFWPSGFLIFLILPLILFNFILLITLIIIKSDTLLWPVIVIITGWYFVINTVHINLKGSYENNPGDLDIVSFGAGFFKENGQSPEISKDMVAWLANDTASIKCIQEFLTVPGSESYDLVKIMNDKEFNIHVVISDSSSLDTLKGMAIISKHAITNSGQLSLNEGGAPDIIFADIEFGEKKVRIYNVKLAPMALKDTARTENIFTNFFGVFRDLGNGSAKRFNEIEELVAHTSKSPYPYLICGDFNEIPYGFNYRNLTKAYRSSFLEQGRGFGFSLNSHAFFLRVDHHFYSRDFEPQFYRVDRNMDLSDHFPVRCVYRLVDPELLED